MVFINLPNTITVCCFCCALCELIKRGVVVIHLQKTGNAIRALGRMVTLSAASRRNSGVSSAPTSPRPSLSMSRMSSLSEEDDKTNRMRMCSERSDSGISDCSSINTRPLLGKKYSISEESCAATNLCEQLNGNVMTNVSVLAKKRTTNSLRPFAELPPKAPSPTLQKDAKLFGKSENFQRAIAFWKQ